MKKEQMIEYLKERVPQEHIFNKLNPLVQKWFKQKFNEFSEPQQWAIPTIQNNENILVSAPTGSGKTLTAFTTILSQLITLQENKLLEDKVYCVYISPLKALSYDITVN